MVEPLKCVTAKDEAWVTALGGARAAGYVLLEEAPPLGLILLRAEAALAGGMLAPLGLTPPPPRALQGGAAGWQVGWLGPDEFLLIGPLGQVREAMAKLRAEAGDAFHLLADLSAARVALRLQGAGAREVIAKACPVDLAPEAFGPGEIRRSHAGQVGVTFWLEAPGDCVFLLAARSVAGYLFELLATLSRPGSEIGIFDPPLAAARHSGLADPGDPQ